MLIREQPFSVEAQAMAEHAGWDLEAVLEWVKLNPRVAPELPTSSVLFTIPVSVLLFVALALPMLLGLIFVNDLGNGCLPSYVSHNVLQCVFAGSFWSPSCVGIYRHSMESSGAILVWIPTGTLIAKVSGSVISIVINALELNMAADGFWMVGTLRAIKVGFCGCLTTVSSFVSQQGQQPHEEKAQPLPGLRLHFNVTAHVVHCHQCRVCMDHVQLIIH